MFVRTTIDMIILEFNSNICYDKVHVRYRDCHSRDEWYSMVIDIHTLFMLIQNFGMIGTKIPMNDQLLPHLPLLYHGAPITIPMQSIIPYEIKRNAVKQLALQFYGDTALAPGGSRGWWS